MTSATVGICPICLLEDCERTHSACSGSDPDLGLRCAQCGETLREESRDGRCGFCHEEDAL